MQNLFSCIQSYSPGINILAEKAGIELNRIQGIVAGHLEPTMKDVRKLAKALKVSIDFLLSESQEYEEVTILFRQAIQNNEQYKADRISYIIKNCLSILDGAHFTTAVFDNFPNVNNDYEGAKTLAYRFRELYFNEDYISPILELPTIVPQALNCILLVVELGDRRDGASAIIDNIPFILISPRFEPRMLFTLAHELGHIIAHHEKNKNSVHVDKDTQFNKSRVFNQEAFAHAFASEILMPAEGIGRTLMNIRNTLNLTGDYFGEIELLFLSRFYGVSFEAAALRCENLGIVPVGTATSLYESISKEYSNPENRARQLGLPDRPPFVFPKVSENLIHPAIEKIKSGNISLEKASEYLSLSAMEILKYNYEN